MFSLNGILYFVTIIDDIENTIFYIRRVERNDCDEKEINLCKFTHKVFGNDKNQFCYSTNDQNKTLSISS